LAGLFNAIFYNLLAAYFFEPPCICLQTIELLLIVTTEAETE